MNSFAAQGSMGYLEGKKLTNFLGKSRCCEEVVDSVLREVGSWLMITKEFKDYSLSIFMNNWITGISLNIPRLSKALMDCHPPNMGYFKMTFGGESKENSGSVGFGCVLYDWYGHVIRVISGLLGVCDSTKVESMWLLVGLHEIKKLGIGGCIVERDSGVVIAWEKGKGERHWCVEIGSLCI